MYCRGCWDQQHAQQSSHKPLMRNIRGLTRARLQDVMPGSPGTNPSWTIEPEAQQIRFFLCFLVSICPTFYSPFSPFFPLIHFYSGSFPLFYFESFFNFLNYPPGEYGTFTIPSWQNPQKIGFQVQTKVIKDYILLQDMLPGSPATTPK